MNVRLPKMNLHRAALPLLAVMVFFCTGRLTVALADGPAGKNVSPSERAQNVALSNLLQSGYLSGTNSTPSATQTTSNASIASTESTAATNSPAHANSVYVLDDKYRLAIGDKVSFQIIEDEDDPKELTVTDSGDLQVPYIGRFPAAGKTCKELAAALKVQLEKDYYKQATVVIAVDLKPKSRGKVYLVGAVRTPGAQDISSDEVLTVSKAILRAGGFAEFANEKEVRITRDIVPGTDDRTNIVVNVERIFEKGKIEDDVALRPGDLIYVPERLIRF